MLGWFGLDDETKPGEADRTLARLARDLSAAGLRVAGAIQINIDQGADCACDMEVLVIGEDGIPLVPPPALVGELGLGRLRAGRER